jgi:hypothetical protein
MAHPRGTLAAIGLILAIIAIGTSGVVSTSEMKPVIDSEPDPARRATAKAAVLLERPASELALVGVELFGSRPLPTMPPRTEMRPAIEAARGNAASSVSADPGWVARRISVPALGIDVPVIAAQTAADEDFPSFSGAYLHSASSQPGRGTNAYIYAHAMPELFKPLWGASVGQLVLITMSDGQVLVYEITRVVRDVPCPDPAAPKPADLPPILANATSCDTSWLDPTPTEQLTLQTSQGFNRNYGELVIIAQPVP